jgi:hypothetical protein
MNWPLLFQAKRSYNDDGIVKMKRDLDGLQLLACHSMDVTGKRGANERP